MTQNRSPLWSIEIGFDLLFDQPVKSDYRITRLGFMYKNFRIHTDKVKARLKYLKHIIRGIFDNMIQHCFNFINDLKYKRIFNSNETFLNLTKKAYKDILIN